MNALTLLALTRGAAPMRAGIPLKRKPSAVIEADEGLLDRELASEDPIEAWLDRYLTPPAR